MSLAIHCKYEYFDSTGQRAEDRRQKFYFCGLPFAVNVKLNLSIIKIIPRKRVLDAGQLFSSSHVQNDRPSLHRKILYGERSSFSTKFDL